MKSKKDTQIQKLISQQKNLQQKQINLIASESYAPQGVLNALGSVLTDKYSEGYPAKRYYPGNKIHNEIELLAQKRALQLFKLSSKDWGVNVQPYSGAIANGEIYAALLKPNDVILALDLMSGGHLSHGSKVSITGKLYRVYHYGVDADYRIDYKQIEKLAREYKPKLIISGASAYPFQIDFKKIGTIAKKIGAYHLADISHYAGLISAGVYQSPFVYADIVMSTTHKSLHGPRGAIIWSRKELAEKIDKAVFPGMQGGPHDNTIAAIAHGLQVTIQSKQYYKRVAQNAKTLARTFQELGGTIVGGGTDSHVVLIDVRPFGLHGGEAQDLLEQAHVLANRNMIAGDTSAQKPSAVRLGTYAITQRKMGSQEVEHIARIIYGVFTDKKVAKHIQERVKEITKKFPIKR